MSLILGNDYINPGPKYHLSSDFYVDEASQSVYVIDKPYYSNSTPNVINFNKIPFNYGRIKRLTKHRLCGNPEQVNVNGEMYNVHVVAPFNKGSYCGRQYDLAYKIDYINKNLREGELPCCPNVRFTHEGNAIIYNGRTRPLANLDLPAIEKAYSKTYYRLLGQQGMSLINPALDRVAKLINTFGGGYKGVAITSLALTATMIAMKIATRTIINQMSS